MPEGDPRRADTPSRNSTSTIFIVDDDSLVREAFRDMLEEGGWTVEDYSSCEAFLKSYRPGREGCLLIDSYLPGMSSLELLRQIQTAGHPLRAIMVTGTGDVQLAVEAMKAGAVGFIEKPVERAELLDSVERALGQAKDATKATALRKAAADHVAGLTARQRQVLDLVLAGHSSKRIAADLSISQRTVENHRASIMHKTGSKSIPALARLAFVSTLSPDSAKEMRKPEQVEAGLVAPDLTGVLDNAQFKRFFDLIPTAIIISEIKEPEHITYVNPMFEQMTGQSAAEVEGQPWAVLHGHAADGQVERTLGEAITDSVDYVGCFRIERAGSESTVVDVYSNLIEDENSAPIFRLAALLDAGPHDEAQRREFEQKMREKDAQMLEIQHRVKNNLQMVTSLIRIEARNARGKMESLPFDRLAGRVSAIQLLYKLLSDAGSGDEIDLGIYLSEVVSSVMHAHAVEGIRLDLKVDAYPVSVNVAMPTGLVVNELLTNSLKHAFVGRDGGTITLRSFSEDGGCRVVIADDGIGLPDGVQWPKHGKLGELIVRSLRQNAKADLKVKSSPAQGTRVTISFTRTNSAATAEH